MKQKSIAVRLREHFDAGGTLNDSTTDSLYREAHKLGEEVETDLETVENWAVGACAKTVKPTADEWQVKETDDGVELIEGGKVCAVVVGATPEALAKIAAAPKMFAALRAANNVLENYPTVAGATCFNPVRLLIRTAIVAVQGKGEKFLTEEGAGR